MKPFFRFLPLMVVLSIISCKEPGELENTYFPAGDGYQWTYEVNQVLDEGGLITIQATDTLTIKVDSIDEGMGVKYVYFDNTFVDVSNKMKVIESDVAVYRNNKEDWIPLVPEKDYVNSNSEKKRNHYKICIDHDTLIFTAYRDILVVSDASVTKRLKGVGVIEQSWTGSATLMDTRMEFRLLYFVKGEDTVWRCEECP
jgi:hypothetical protein